METLNLQLDSNSHSDYDIRSNRVFRYTGALEILRETTRILRYNLSAFMAIGGLLISPVSALHLSNVLIDQSTVKRITVRLLAIANSSGIPLNSFVKQSCHKLSEMAISAIVCFPLYITLFLLSKAAVVYTVECTYSRKKFDPSKFFVIIQTIWKRIISTYFLICVVITGVLISFITLLTGISSLFFALGFSPNSVAYIAIVFGLFFSLFLAQTVIICDLSLVISVLENVSGVRAMLRASVLIRDQTRVGLMLFLGSTIGMAVVKGLLEYRVKSLRFGDGFLIIWEGLILVLVYSFVVFIDFMMSSVFYFSCKSCSLEASGVEHRRVLQSSSPFVADLEDR